VKLKSPGFKILVVDEGLPLAGALGELVETGGDYVLGAKNGEEALEKTRAFQPHLILLSTDLGGGASLELLPELLLEDVGAAVIMMAKVPGVSEAVQAIKLGAEDYLEFPLDSGKLRRAIEDQKAFCEAH
jgi:DNA-binding NtrC family response regulator